MRIDIITAFPDMFEGAFDESIIKRAKDKKLLNINFVNLRDFTKDRHKVIDDYPFGGGGGMILKPEPLFEAIKFAKKQTRKRKKKVVFLTPQGEPYTQNIAWELSELKHLILLCGRYEGIDERIREHLIDREISIGDYVLSGGEIPAMIVVDTLTRLIPGVLGNEDSPLNDSFTSRLLDFPHYTRPAVFKGWEVPEVLRSGNHREIEKWRQGKAFERTFKARPDLIEKVEMTREEKKLIKELEE